MNRADQAEIVRAMRRGAALRRNRTSWVLLLDGIDGPGFGVRTADGRSVNALVRRGLLDRCVDGSIRLPVHQEDVEG